MNVYTNHRIKPLNSQNSIGPGEFL